MSVTQQARMLAFKAIRAIRERRANGPTLFNPHYQIKPMPVQSKDVTSKTGPQMMTQQWEATGRKPTK